MVITREREGGGEREEDKGGVNCGGNCVFTTSTWGGEHTVQYADDVL